MSRISYTRVSTEDQDLERQVEAINSYGKVDVMYCEKLSGKEGVQRPVFEKMLATLKEGDVVVVHTIDRFGRSLGDFISNTNIIKSKGASLEIASIGLVFGNNIYTDAMFQILMVFAELERNIISERVKGGLAIARRAGKCKGRKPSITAAEMEAILLMRADGMSFAKIGEEFDVSASAIQKAIKRQEMGLLEINKEFWAGSAAGSVAGFEVAI